MSFNCNNDSTNRGGGSTVQRWSSMRTAKVRVPVETDLNLTAGNENFTAKSVIMHETIKIEFLCHGRCETLNNGHWLKEGLK